MSGLGPASLPALGVGDFGPGLDHVAEALLPSVLPCDPRFGNLHLFIVLIGSLVAVVVDWVIRQARRRVEDMGRRELRSADRLWARRDISPSRRSRRRGRRSR